MKTELVDCPDEHFTKFRDDLGKSDLSYLAINPGFKGFRCPFGEGESDYMRGFGISRKAPKDSTSEGLGLAGPCCRDDSQILGWRRNSLTLFFGQSIKNGVANSLINGTVS